MAKKKDIQFKRVAKRITKPEPTEIVNEDDFEFPDEDPPEALEEQEHELSWATTRMGKLLVKVGATINANGDVSIRWIQDRFRPEVIYKFAEFSDEERLDLQRRIRRAAGICGQCFGAKRVKGPSKHDPEISCPRCKGTGEEP